MSPVAVFSDAEQPVAGAALARELLWQIGEDLLTTLLEETATPTRHAELRDAKRTPPIKVWAAIGAFFLAFEAYLVIRWIAIGDASRTDPGPTPVPGWMTGAALAITICGLVAYAIVGYVFIIRPWRRDGRLGFDGMLAIVCFLLYWHDPMGNYTQHWTSYNAAIFNLGSWAPGVPGWLAPRGNLYAEPFLFVAPAYLYVIFSMTVVACAIMRKAKERWPHISAIRLVMICFAFLFLFDVVMECVFVRLGLYAFGGSISWLTLFHGHYYQFPIYEALFFGATWTALACVRYFRNDKGETVVERGIDTVAAPRRQKTWLRFLALLGIGNVAWLGLYDIPIQIFALHADAWPEDITSRSYLLDGLCGPDTGYACPGPEVPIPRPDSAHLDEDGHVVDPGGR